MGNKADTLNLGRIRRLMLSASDRGGVGGQLIDSAQDYC